MPYSYEELQGSLALAYGPHVVSGHIIKKTTEGTGESAQSYVVVWLGEGVWNSIRGAYFNGAEIPSSDYHFHHGYLANSMDEAVFEEGEWTQGVDPWNHGGIPYSGTAYVIVKLPQGVTNEDDLSDLKFICECLRVPDFDQNGNQINSIGAVVALPNEPLVESEFTYSTNPARCIADLLMVRRGLPRKRIRWSAWHAWKQVCSPDIDWVGGEQAGRPAYNNVGNVILGVDGNAVKAYGTTGWNGTATTVSTIPSGQDGWFSVDPGTGTFLAGLAPVGNALNPDNVPVFLRFQSGGTVYIQSGPSILSSVVGGWSANDTFKIGVEGGEYRLYKNDQPFASNVTLPSVVGDQRGVLLFFSQQSEVLSAAFRPINSGRRSRQRFECGLAFPNHTDINTAMEAILLVSCSDVQDADGELVFLPPTMAEAPRPKTFDFHMGNISDGTFKTYRLSRDARPTKIPAKFRNVDVATLREDPAEATRDELVDILGHEQPMPELFLGSMTKGQAECVLNYRIRLHSDLDLYCSFEADGTSWQVIPGDVCGISHDVPGWTDELFMCIEATDLPTINGEADRRKFLFQKFHPATYSDTDHTPIQVSITPTIPNVLNGAPAVRNVTITNESGFNTNRVWQHQIRGVIDFGLFPAAQKAWVYYSLFSEGYVRDYVINGSPFTPDANNQAEFTFTPLRADTYRIRVVTANQYGVIDTNASPFQQDVPIGGQPRSLTAPAAFSAQATLDSIEFRITPPVGGLQQGDHYEVWASTGVNNTNNRLQTNAPDTWTEKFDDTTPSPLYRWVRVVDGMGNASALTPLNGGTGVTINRLTQVQGFDFTFDGRLLGYAFTPLARSAGVREYQVASDLAFTTIKTSGPSQPLTEVPSGLTRTVTRYLRAMDYAGNYSPVTGPVTKTFGAISAPGVILKESYPSSAVYTVTPPSNIRYSLDVKLIVQMATDATFANVIDEMALDATTTRFTINGAASVRPTVYVRAYYVDAFGAGAIGIPTPSTYTFTKFSAADLQNAIIGTAQFAAGLQPVILVTSKPTLPNATYPVDTVISVTSENGKLYRNIAESWQSLSAGAFSELTGQINPATQIPNGGITNALLAANSVNAANIVSASIDPTKLNVEVGGGNLLINSSFEDVLTNGGYTGFTGTASRVALPGQHGSYAVQVTHAGGNILFGSGTTAYPSHNVLPNGKYVFSFWAKAGTGATGNLISARLDWYNASAVNVGSSIGTAVALTTSWARYSVVATAPATAATVGFGAGGSGVTGVVYVDSFQLEQGNVLTAYAPKSGDILPGTITNALIAPNAIDYSKMASGLRPIETVSALPTLPNTTYPVNSYVTLSTDGRLYKNVSNVWVDEIRAANLTGQITTTQITDNAITTQKITANAVTANQIAANTITANQIAANTITAAQIAASTITATQLAANSVTANQIAANAVTAGKVAANSIDAVNIVAGAIRATHLQVGTFSDNLVLNPSFEAGTTTPDGWYGGYVGNNGTFGRDTSQVYDGAASLSVVNTSGASSITIVVSKAMPVTPGATYAFRARYKAAAATGAVYIGLYQKDAVPTNGTYITNEDALASNITTDAVSNVTPTTSWQQVDFVYTVPAGIKFVSVRCVYTGSTGTGYFDGIELRQQFGATNIANGVITTNHIATNTIVANDIAARTITANEIAVGAITANEIAANTITAAKIAAGAITANELAANSVTANQIAVGAVTAQKLTIGNFSAINTDPGVSDITAWTWDSSGGASWNPQAIGVIANITDGVAGRTVLQNQASTRTIMYSKPVPYDPNKQYRVSVWMRTPNGGSGSLFGVMGFDSSGNPVAGNAGAWYFQQYFSGSAGIITPTGTWTQHIGVFGAGTSTTLSSTVKTIAVGVQLNWITPSSTGNVQVQDLRLDEMVVSTVIANDAITTAKIAAGAITAEKLTIGAITDNLVYNPSFEAVVSGTSRPDGWQRAHAAPLGVTQGVSSYDTTYRTEGYKSLQINGPYMAMGCRAFPVVVGGKYLVRFKAYSPSASGNWYCQVNEFNGDLTVPYLGFTGIQSPGVYTNMTDADVQDRTSSTVLVSANTLTSLNAGWTTYEFTYTVPANIKFINIAFLNWTTTGGTQLHIDEVEVRRQVRAVHIEDGAITALKITANTITAAQIAAGTITAAQIAADTITAGNIAAGAITASELAVGAVQATHIAANAITALQIAAGAVTANAIAAGTIRADMVTAAVGKIGMVFPDQIISNDFIPHEPSAAHAETLMWTEKLNVSRTADGGLYRSATTSVWDGGAVSTRAIFKGDGYIEFYASETNTAKMVGLTWRTIGGSYTNLNAAWHMDLDGNAKIYENGAAVGSYGPYVPNVTVLRIAIEGNNFVYYKDGVAVYSRSGVTSNGLSKYRNIQYPMRAGASLYTTGATVNPITLYGIISPASRTAPLADTELALPAHVTRLSGGDFQTSTTAGGMIHFANRINAGDGFMEFGTPAAAATAQGWVAGFTSPNGGGTDLLGAVHHSTNGTLYAYSPAGFVSTSYTYNTDGTEVYRVSAEGNLIVIRHMGQTPPFYQSAYLPSSYYPLRPTVSLPGTVGSVSPGNIHFGAFGTEGQGWKMHPTSGITGLGTGEFNEGLMIRNTPITESVVRSVASINKDFRYRGNDRGVVPTSQITWIDIWGYKRFFEDGDVYVRLYLNIDNYRNYPATANADSVDHMLVRVYNKFGDQIDYMYYPYNGRGVAYVGFHSREFADPVDEAVYAFEIHNVFGYSRRVYYSQAPWITSTTSGWVNRGTVAPVWLQRSNVPSDANAMASSDTAVTVTWTPAPNTTGHSVFYQPFEPAGTTNGKWIQAVTGLSSTASSYTVTGLSPNTRYQFIAHASMSWGWSNVATARTLPTLPAAASLPTVAAPTGLSAQAVSTSGINLSWTNSSNNTTEIFRGGALLTTVAAGVASYSDTGLTAGTAYTYKVRHNSSGTLSGFSNDDSTTTQTTITQPPVSTAPYNCQAAATGMRTASVTFTNPGAAATVQWGTDGANFPYSSASGVTSPYTATPLAAGTTYFFRVTNASGTSNVSSTSTDPYIPPDRDPIGCVTFDTRILTMNLFNGQFVWKNAIDIRPADAVIAITPEGNMVVSHIKSAMTEQTTRLYTISTSGGQQLHCSPSHPIISGFGDTTGRYAEQFSTGDTVLVYNEISQRAEETTISSIDSVEMTVPVIIFEMEDAAHTFVSEGIVSHNIAQKPM